MSKHLVSREQLEKDSRFYINSETLSSLMKHHKIYSYDIEEIKLGHIRRYKDKKLSTLYATDHFKYVTDPNSEENRRTYRVYCAQKENLKDNPNRSEAVFNTLIDTFVNEDYDPKKGIIIIDQYHCIVDGFHRSCILLHKLGSEHPVTVLKLTYETGYRIKLLSPFFELKQKFGLPKKR